MTMKKTLTKLTLVLGFVAGTALYAPAAMSVETANAAASAASNGPTTTESGLQYFDLAVGKGQTAQAGDTVYVHYTGWLQNADGSLGKKFDSSRDRGEPLSFHLGHHEVIRGWDEGVQGMKIGGERKLIIPSALAYGPRGIGNGLIPPNANLIFEVELIKIR
jgi:FKBP-type peptidyl-prolyl cis-trans isomerase FkpA